MTDLLLAVDCDEVLSDYRGAMLKLAADKFNVFATYDQITSDDVGPSIGCAGLEYAVDEEVLYREFVYKMKPIPEGIAFLRELENRYDKENVVICTSPWAFDSRERATGEWASQRYAWLRDFAGIPKKRVIMASMKHLVRGILIDDRAKNLEARAPNAGYCIAHPHNTAFKGPRGNYEECLIWLEERAAMVEHGVYA
jgi:5'(3')-deoxyribonucleotidase